MFQSLKDRLLLLLSSCIDGRDKAICDDPSSDGYVTPRSLDTPIQSHMSQCNSLNMMNPSRIQQWPPTYRETHPMLEGQAHKLEDDNFDLIEMQNETNNFVEIRAGRQDCY